MWLKTPREDPEHTDSYYAATAGGHHRYPVLRAHLRADVVVVGGGFTGVNTALELAERGYEVVLLEAHRIGWGASGRNGGQVIGGIGHSAERFENEIGKDGVRAIYDMGVECCEIIRARVAQFGIDCDLKWGYADVALKPRHMREFAAHRDYLVQMGYPYPVEILDAGHMRSRVNSPRYIGGSVNQHGWGHVHPLSLCQGEARAAAGLGVRIFEQSRVTRLQDTATPGVKTAQGEVRADHVILCGNAYLGDLVPRLAARVLPATSSVIATEPLGQLADEIMPADLAVCDPRTALDYFRLSADRRLLFGGQCNYTGLESADVDAVMRRKMLRVFPQLAAVGIDYRWSGQLGIGINRMPQAGRLNGSVYYIQAYSGHGVAPSHVMGRIAAQMIAGQAERFDVFARIRHWPFPGGRLLRRPGMALGMLYYKMKDAI